ncbi:MAG: glutamate formimidoyltransferase [Armatimonadota bacterium]|nr:glutamate formimidoyltransferase [bacterium]
MSKLVQCVPNFSEGRRREVVEKIVAAIDAASEVRVVDYSMDVDHNRSVVTFNGEPGDIRASVLAGARVAVEMIDLNKHTGGHPRIGAVDVVPVVPLGDMAMDEAVELGHAIGRDIADNLHVPVYFYENCALRNECVNLADVRKGGFERLRERGLTGGRVPDLGPDAVHPTAGACVVGARGPLIAYNVNLKTGDVVAASAIAAKIRQLRDSGEAMPGVKAIGVYLESRGIAQVSMNITRPDLVNLWDVYSLVEEQAREMGIEVLESELIGAMWGQHLVDAAASALKCRSLTRERILDK